MPLYPHEGGAWVQYRPPKSSSFGHHARKRDPVAAWEMTKAFLRRHTIAVSSWRSEIPG